MGVGVRCLHVEGPQMPANPTPRREAWSGWSLRVSESASHARTLIWDSWPQNWDEQCLSFKLHTLGAEVALGS